MANFCSNCGKQLYPNEDRCPSCGMYIEEERRESSNNENNSSSNYQNGGQNYNNNGGYNGGYNGGPSYNNGSYNNGSYNNSGYNNSGYNNGGYNNGGYAPGYYVPPQTPVKRPLNVGLLIFSIINIIIGCCGLGTILGIVALVVTINATNSQTDADEKSKLNTALILNVVSIVLLALAVVYFVVLLALA
jgi:hypothetical protein